MQILELSVFTMLEYSVRISRGHSIIITTCSVCTPLQAYTSLVDSIVAFCSLFPVSGLEINEARPDDKLPYRGAWLWVGSEMIHLMELPNPDPLTGRPEHGGRDRHTCIAIKDVAKLKAILDDAGKHSTPQPPTFVDILLPF